MVAATHVCNPEQHLPFLGNASSDLAVEDHKVSQRGYQVVQYRGRDRQAAACAPYNETAMIQDSLQRLTPHSYVVSGVRSADCGCVHSVETPDCSPPHPQLDNYYVRTHLVVAIARFQR